MKKVVLILSVSFINIGGNTNIRGIKPADLQEEELVFPAAAIFVEDESKELRLKDFQLTNDVSKKFDGLLHSRSLFSNKFVEIEVLPRLPASTDYLFEQKIVEKNAISRNDFPNLNAIVDEIRNVDRLLPKMENVNVGNLVEPREDRKLRAINTAHVYFLEKSLAECQGADYIVLLGLLVNGDVEKAEEEGACTTEVLGGNHTRAAVKLLYQKGAREPLVLMTIYGGQVTDEEALKLGLHHKTFPGRSREMTFVEMVHLVRRFVNDSNMYKKLQAISGNQKTRLAESEGRSVGAEAGRSRSSNSALVTQLENETLKLRKEIEARKKPGPAETEIIQMSSVGPADAENENGQRSAVTVPTSRMEQQPPFSDDQETEPHIKTKVNIGSSAHKLQLKRKRAEMKKFKEGDIV